MPSQELLKVGEDARKNWRAVNELIRRVGKLEADVRTLLSSVEFLRGRPDMKGAGASGMVFKGEYNPILVYKVGECVKISFGGTAGFYIKTASSGAGADPSLGEVWAKIGNVLDQNNWV